MKRRIRSIFWLMVLCMVGINGFQAYWLYNTYQLTATQFARTAREALASVVQRYQLNDARRFMAHDSGANDKLVVFQHITDDGHFDRTILRQRPDFVKPVRQQIRVQRRLAEGVTVRFGVNASAADTMVRNISRLLLNSWGGGKAVDLRQLAADYRAEMRLRGADAVALLDTARMPIRKIRQVPANFGRFPARPGFTVETPPVVLNPFQDLYVRAAFQPPTPYILRQMGGLLVGSVLLLVLTTGCFWLMLSTILQQKKLSDVKNDFINNMTHELKTPLATVSAAVEALQHFGALNDPAKTQAYLGISRIELQRLSDLVEKVLNIAVENQHPLTLNPEWVHPAELVEGLVQQQQLKATKPVEFKVTIAPDDTVRLDRLHMAGVLNNLIDNAVKYSREQVTIAIQGHYQADGWQLTVRDNGIGIPKSYQDSVFDQFFRVPTGNLHPVKGFGMGLYYVRQVVERHGGHIAVRSEPNRGSEFSLWLPATAR